MDSAWIALGAVCLLLGFIGCVVPVIPGVVLGFAALLTLWPTPYALSLNLLVVAGVLLVVEMVLDYVVPSIGARTFKCSGWGVFGCLMGTLVGIFFFPCGLVLGPFLGAFCGELIAGKSAAAAFRGGFGAFLGFLATVVLKFVVVGVYAYLFVSSVI